MFYSNYFSEITVRELAEQIANNDGSLQLIDVRELQEVSFASIPGFTILPLSQFSEWSKSINNRFDPQTTTIVLCHHGVRSAQMCQWLISQGFTQVSNVSGGIDAYSRIIDDGILRY